MNFMPFFNDSVCFIFFSTFIVHFWPFRDQDQGPRCRQAHA